MQVKGVTASIGKWNPGDQCSIGENIEDKERKEASRVGPRAVKGFSIFKPQQLRRVSVMPGNEDDD